MTSKEEDIALGSGTMPDHSGFCVAEVYYSEKGQRMLLTQTSERGQSVITCHYDTVQRKTMKVKPTHSVVLYELKTVMVRKVTQELQIPQIKVLTQSSCRLAGMAAWFFST